MNRQVFPELKAREYKNNFSHRLNNQIHYFLHIFLLIFFLSKSKIIELEDLPEAIIPKETSSLIKPLSMDELESEYLTKALKKNNWSRKKTAEELGIHKTTLWRKIKKLGIIIPHKL